MWKRERGECTRAECTTRRWQWSRQESWEKCGDSWATSAEEAETKGSTGECRIIHLLSLVVVDDESVELFTYSHLLLLMMMRVLNYSLTLLLLLLMMRVLNYSLTLTCCCCCCC